MEWDVPLSLLMWFVFSISLIFLNRFILVELGFRFPLSLTGWHLIFATVCTRSLRKFTTHLDNVKTVSVKLTWTKWATAVLPVGMLFSASLACSNYAYLYLSVSFIQMLKSATPVAILLASISLGTEKADFEVFLNVLVVALGVSIASYGEITFVLLGFVLMVTGISFESVRLVMIQKLLNGNDLKMEAMVSLYYFAPVCAFFNLIVASVTEWPRMTADHLAAVGAFPFLLNGAVSFGLNLASVVVIKKSSTLILGLSGVVKDILIVSLSVIIYQTALSTTQIVGYSIALIALLRYKTRKEAIWQRLETDVDSVHKSSWKNPLLVCLFISAAMAGILWQTSTLNVNYDRLAFEPNIDDLAVSSNDSLIPVKSIPPSEQVRPSIPETPNFEFPSAETMQHLKFKPDPGPKLCVVGRTYGKQLSYLPTFLMSLLQNTSPVHVFLLVTEESPTALDLTTQITKFVNLVVSHNATTVLPFTLKDGASIFKSSPAHQDFGYIFTDLAIDYLIAHEPSCDYVTFTNGDNLYSKNFAGDRLKPHMEAGLDMMVMGYVCYSEMTTKIDKPDESADGSHRYVEPRYQVGLTDLAAGVYRLKFLAETGQRFLTPETRARSLDDTWTAVNPFNSVPEDLLSPGQRSARADLNFMLYAADGYFVERTAILAKTKKLIRGALVAHQ